MRPRSHANLLVQGVVCWAFFWVLGLPDYYQQYSTLALAVGTNLLTGAMALAGVLMLRRLRPERRVERAVWVSFYYTVPLAALDALYCGWYLGHGVRFLVGYWYLSIFYLLPWLVFLPLARLLPRGGEPGRA